MQDERCVCPRPADAFELMGDWIGAGVAGCPFFYGWVIVVVCTAIKIAKAGGQNNLLGWATAPPAAVLLDARSGSSLSLGGGSDSQADSRPVAARIAAASADCRRQREGWRHTGMCAIRFSLFAPPVTIYAEISSTLQPVGRYATDDLLADPTLELSRVGTTLPSPCVSTAFASTALWFHCLRG